jgi:hypothetical protein
MSAKVQQVIVEDITDVFGASDILFRGRCHEHGWIGPEVEDTEEAERHVDEHDRDWRHVLE